ncbi:MAG: 4-(cytidine 5'-diphospho)-2-C-methyl-D-erythritol kinase [Elusimicrobia bacterium RIFOXYA2_FULL_39_19]|nr:MAG: 4-(cytidine 5'-diphospho)-2-C-methyl-D-erythritol kinase [Elusimicrobia bacterium RIFOXYA2_FULL_39_19]
MKLKAPAKVNLFLEITGKRKDGYHTLNTVFQTISLFDEIQISKNGTGKIELICKWLKNEPVNELPPEKNICYKAASLLKETLKEKNGAKIKLIKRIPSGAGLGGGSSDAGVLLKGLLNFWKRKLSQKKLNSLALKFGADVPFFLKGGCCLASGIGEKLTSLKTKWDRDPLFLVLVKPNYSKSTQNIYSKYDDLTNKSDLTYVNNISKIKEHDRVGLDDIVLVNHLENVVFNEHPDLRKIKRFLQSSGAVKSLMSGSGTTVFGIYRREVIARKAARELKDNKLSTWVVHTI